MRALISSISELTSLSRQVLSNSRTGLSIDGTILFCRASFDEPFSSNAVPENLLATDKEEVKHILTSFLKKQGLSNAVAVKTIKKCDLFVDHLLSRLHSVHKPRQLVGRERTNIEIGEALVPYLECLSELHRSYLLDFVKNFPHPPIKVNLATPVSPSHEAIGKNKLRALSRLNKRDLDGQLTPLVLYLLELGMDFEQIKKAVWRFPTFAYCSLEGKIKPLIAFLLDHGVSKSDIPFILYRCPQLCGCSITENLAPTVVLLESLGVDKRLWAKILCRLPSVLTFSRQKIEATVNFLLEMGVSVDNIGNILQRNPNLISSSVDDKLRPIAEYFLSFGVDVAGLLQQNPHIFKLSIESNLKHVTKFFVGKGFSMEELGTMISKFGSFYCYSLAKNLAPKWEFFLTMGYSKEELVKFPHYFGYSLEGRIKPRYALVKDNGVQMKLSIMLSSSDPVFQKSLKKKLDKASSVGSSSANVLS